jgi:hypothetical protein
MASQIEPFAFGHLPFLSLIRQRSSTAHLLLLLSIFLSSASLASAQTSSQQYIYASVSNSPPSSSVSGFTKASQTGALNLVSGSPSTNGWRAA